MASKSELKKLTKLYKKEYSNKEIDEWCPECDTEVKLKPKFKLQSCPTCGKVITPCSMCNDINALNASNTKFDLKGCFSLKSCDKCPLY